MKHEGRALPPGLFFTLPAELHVADAGGGGRQTPGKTQLAHLLGGIMALAIPVAFLVVLWQMSSQEGIRIALLRDKEAIDGKVVELLSGIESVRAANTECHETQKVDILAESLRKKEIRHHTLMALFDCVKYLNEGAFHIAMIATSVYLATRGVITTGDVLTYSLLFIST